MKNLEYNSVTVNLTAGDQVKEADFPIINGRIIGLSTTLIGDRAGKRVRLALKDGGNETHRPLDVAFSETSGRSSFSEGLVPLNVKNPGRMTASIQLDSPLEGAENIKVEVLLVCEKQENFENELC